MKKETTQVGRNKTKTALVYVNWLYRHAIRLPSGKIIAGDGDRIGNWIRKTLGLRKLKIGERLDFTDRDTRKEIPISKIPKWILK